MKPIWIVLSFAVIALAGCAEDKDSDNDGLLDSLERAGWTVTVDTMTQRLVYTVSPDANNFDTDGDGLSDLTEFIQIPATDPTKADTDGDGLTDCQEALHTVISECLDQNFTDYDGGYPTEATWADSDPGQSKYVQEILQFTGPDGLPLDTDHGDGISDFDEIMGYEVTYNGKTSIVTSDPRKGDADEDFLSDGGERHFGSHPHIQDSDGDHCMDGLDDNPNGHTFFTFGFDSFTLAQNQPQKDVQIFALFHGQAVTTPQEAARMSGGDTISLENPAPFQIDCVANDAPFSTWLPRVQMEFIAFNPDDENDDIQIQETRHALEWNLRTGTFTKGDISYPTNQITLQGVDGTLRLAPKIVPQ